MAESRVQKTLLNARVNLIFYFANLIMSFFSRKIFLDAMSADFIGLSSTLMGFLGFLSLVELGIGQSVGYALYKPLFDNDRKKINEIVSVLGYLYYWVGLIILACGITVSMFFPLIFAKENYPMLLIYVMFYSFLGSTLLTYFVNYRQSLLGADQRYYIVNAYTQASSITCYILQIVVVYYTANAYLWIAIYLASSIFSSFIINWKIRKQYPWLKAAITLGKEKYREYPDIIKKTKQLFIHKIACFVQFQFQPVIMYSVASLRSVGMYDNYAVISTKLNAFVSNFLNSMTASVGNLVAENNKEKILKIFYELFSAKMFIAGVFAFGLWHLTEPFISLWLGKEYVMSKLLLILVVLNSYVMQTRGITDHFINAYGIFRDVWAPITEVIISFTVAVVGGYLIGIEGVLLGTLVSMLIIVVLWKPFLLYKDGFKEKVSAFWIYYSKSLCGLIISVCISSVIIHYISNLVCLYPDKSLLTWLFYSVMSMSVFVVIYFLSLFALTQGMRNFTRRLSNIIKNKLH